MINVPNAVHGGHLLPLVNYRVKAATDAISVAQEVVTDYNAYIGQVAEQAIRDVVALCLPGTLAIGTGIVIDGNGQQSRQMDLVIYDQSKPVFDLPGGVRFFPVEGTVLGIEVKATIASRAQVRGAFANVASLKACTRTVPQEIVTEFQQPGKDGRFLRRPFGLVVSGRSLGPVQPRDELVASATGLSTEARARSLPDMYVALASTRKSGPHRRGWVISFLEYSEDLGGRIVSPHAHNSVGVAVDTGADWTRHFIYYIDILCKTGLEAIAKVTVPVDLYLQMQPYLQLSELSCLLPPAVN